jgi:diguanylate cyclase (GGDEF)-like protein
MGIGFKELSVLNGGTMPCDEKEMTPLFQLYANVGKLITSSLDLNEILEGIMKEVRFFFQPENWSLFRLDPASSQLFFMIAEGVEFETVKNIQLRLNEGIAGTVAATNHYIYVPDTAQDTRFSNRVDQATGYVTKSIIAVPVTFRDRVFGVLEVINPHENECIFTKADLMILQTIADFAAIAFANSAAYSLSAELAERDPLTGLYNRSKLDKLVDYCNSGSAPHRRQQDCNLTTIAVFIDMNNFKEVNDQFGHREGDIVLKDAANLFRTFLRHDDYIFRIGGDEFLILINIREKNTISIILDRLNSKLPKQSREFAESHHGITFSYGIAQGRTDQLSDVIHRADEEMYRMKNK